MSRNKTSGFKKRLIRAKNSNRRVPAWAIMRTQRKLMFNAKQRNWRRRKLKI